MLRDTEEAVRHMRTKACFSHVRGKGQDPWVGGKVIEAAVAKPCRNMLVKCKSGANELETSFHTSL